jgi:N-acetylglutamate synthase-like GNAT family acetyltransferase
MEVVPADGALVERIFDLTHPIWHDGLSRRAYSLLNSAQLRTPWGAERLRRFALVDTGGDVLASAKQYRYDVRLDGRTGWMCGFGAVFTPPDRRGHGHGRTLLERLMETAHRQGALFAALFSEIGTAYYERLGFRAIALDEVTVKVRRKHGAPAMLVRAGDDRDLPAVAAMHEPRTGGARLALVRDEMMLRATLVKKRLFAGLSAPGSHRLEFFVAEEGASAVAYAVISSNQYGWTLEEAGDRDPAGARLGAMFQVLLAREPSQEMPIIRTWWPRSFPVPPQIELARRTDARDVFMVRPLVAADLPSSADDVFYWRADYF